MLGAIFASHKCHDKCGCFHLQLSLYGSQSKNGNHETNKCSTCSPTARTSLDNFAASPANSLTTLKEFYKNNDTRQYIFKNPPKDAYERFHRCFLQTLNVRKLGTRLRR
ncbi:hypothetical protein Pelo_7746 [Pelomyxa schiedti]|nr:hypothetical protein Pelo_7746 [Pelomyxa schiedti]